MDAIIYTTNTGSTEQYAKLLAQETGLPVYSFAEAKKQVFSKAKIIYLGFGSWLVRSRAMLRLQNAIGYVLSAELAWDRPGRK